MPVTSKRFNAEADPAKSLMVLRIIWAALLMGQVLFLGVVLMLRSQGSASPSDAGMLKLLFFVEIALAALTIPVAFFVRRMVMGLARPIPMQKYFTGTIIFLAMLEGVSLFGLVVLLLGAPLQTGLIVPAVAMVLQVISFPTGPA